MSRTAAQADASTGGGRRRPSASRRIPTLAIEAAVIFGLLAVAGVLVWHFTVHHVHNPLPLGGANVDVSDALGEQTQAAFALDPARPGVLVGASNDSLSETLDLYRSTDDGRTWTKTDGPAAPGGSCSYGSPRLAFDGAGREYLAFLVGRYCGDELTPYLVVGTRTAAGAPWRLARLTRPAWTYGFDDGPALAVDPHSGTAYAAYERSLSKNVATSFLSRSVDHGRTWSAPVEIASSLVRPHLLDLAVGRDGTLYVAGIDAKLGVWLTRSTDGGRSFAPPRRVAPLVANPAASCSLAGLSPVPREQTRCQGPDPTVLALRDGVAVVYGDAGDVFVSVLGSDLRPRFRAQVNPPDGKHATQQFLPAAAIDPRTGVLWACWYDGAFDSAGHDVWYTCSASRTGRTWSAPERAAAVPTDPADLYRNLGTRGLATSVVASGGAVHAFWVDGRRYQLETDVWTARLLERAELRR